MNDNLKQTNKQYNTMLPIWNKNRQAESGNDAIKSAGETYLPRMNGHDDEDYKAYLKRALYYNFVGRTTNGLKGMVFRKDPIINLPPEMELFKNNITMGGKSLNSFMQTIVKEVINPSRVGILLDYPDTDTTGMTLAEAQQKNIKPYLSMYTAESIINWRTESINNVDKLTMAVIKENAEIVNKTDKFKSDSITRYRVLELIDNVYTVSVYDAKENGTPEQIGETIKPIVDGKKLDYIPFYILNQNGISNEITTKPVIDDLTDINIAHYVNSADYENALHWSGVRTVIVSGWPSDKPLELGTAMAIPETAKAYFLNAPTDDALTQAMAEKERILVSLGANLITSQAIKTTATESLIQQQGETSVITDIANNCSNVFTMILKTMANWYGVKDEKAIEEINIELNVDYNPKTMTGADALALANVWQLGGIDRATLNYNYRKGEIIAENTDDETLEENIKKEKDERDGDLFNVPVIE